MGILAWIGKEACLHVLGAEQGTPDRKCDICLNEAGDGPRHFLFTEHGASDICQAAENFIVGTLTACSSLWRRRNRR